MALFSYVVLDESGTERRGQIDGNDKNDAIRQLRGKKWFVVEIKSGGEDLTTGGRFALFDPRRYLPVRQIDRINFFRQLSLMLRSGHTVLQSLDSLQGLVERPRLRHICATLADDIRGGKNFSRAIGECGVFAPLVGKLLEAGEASGELDAICEQIADNLERQSDLRRQLITSLTYPAITVLISIVVVIFLVLGVLPKFATFLQAKGAQLPSGTQKLLDLSAFVQDWGVHLGVGAGIAIFAVLAAYTTTAGKNRIDSLLLKIPLIGGTLMAAAMAQFGWTLAMLLRSGMTAMDSLRVCAAIQGNAGFAAAIAYMADEVLRGNSLSVSMSTGVFPKMVRHLVAVGERSGELDAVMDEIGQFYKKDLDVRIKRMTALIEPTLTLGVGGLVGFIYFAFFQAVMAVSTGGR